MSNSISSSITQYMVRIFSCYHNSSEWEFKLIDPEEVGWGS